MKEPVPVASALIDKKIKNLGDWRGQEQVEAQAPSE